MQKLRRATPGEFTRRAFANGRIDLAEAEGLADLLEAETELQRRSAMAMAGGALSRRWRTGASGCSALSAQIEAVLDFADEDDVSRRCRQVSQDRRNLPLKSGSGWSGRARKCCAKASRWSSVAAQCRKKQLVQCLVENDAAIVSADRRNDPRCADPQCRLEGVPFQFFDTAGVREQRRSDRAIGIERALRCASNGPIWSSGSGRKAGSRGGLGDRDRRPICAGRAAKLRPAHCVSAATGAGLMALRQRSCRSCPSSAMPKPGEVALNCASGPCSNRRPRALANAAVPAAARSPAGAEDLRRRGSRSMPCLAATTTEDMLDALFGRFCIGK
jgi:tRNA modification GTPase